jgi:hypothetical protein
MHAHCSGLPGAKICVLTTKYLRSLKNLLSLFVSVSDPKRDPEDPRSQINMEYRRLYHTLKFSFNTSTLLYERRQGLFFILFVSFIANPDLDIGEPNQSGHGSETRPNVYLRSPNSRFRRHSASG